RLGRSEGDAVSDIVLERDKELFTAPLCLLVEVVSPLELALERELSNERHMFAPRAPHRNIGLGRDSFAEVEHANIQQHLLDELLAHQFDSFVFRSLQGCQSRENAREGGHGGAVSLMNLAHDELHIVGVEHTEPADLIAQRQGLRLELQLVLAGNVRPDIQFRSLLQIRVPELEDYFRLTHGKAVFVGNAPAQDEGIVVKFVVRSVEENDLPYLGSLAHHGISGKPYTEIIGRTAHKTAELMEARHRGEAVGLQNNLALKIFDVIKGMAVAVGPLLKFGNPFGPGRVFRHDCSSAESSWKSCRYRVICS